MSPDRGAVLYCAAPGLPRESCLPHLEIPIMIKIPLKSLLASALAMGALVASMPATAGC